jgi:hypothetical protein
LNRAVREQKPDRRPKLGEHAEPALAAGRRIFPGQQCWTTPLAAEAYSLAEAERAKDCRRRHAKGSYPGRSAINIVEIPITSSETTSVDH